MEEYPPGTTSLTGTGPVFLACGEFFVVCPYVSNHKPLNTHFFKHLYKCRSNYQQGILTNGETPVLLSCKHNYKHQVLAPEILYHEFSCGDRKFECLDRVSAEEWEHVEKLASKEVGIVLEKIELPGLGAFTFTDLVRKHENRPQMTAIKQFVPRRAKALEQRDIILPFSAEKLKQMRKDMARKRGRHHQAGESVEEVVPDVPETPSPLEPVVGEEEEKEEADVDEDEEWKSDANEPPFYWITSWRNLKTPNLSFPPGLSKQQRKEFIKYNTQRMESAWARSDTGFLPYDERTLQIPQNYDEVLSAQLRDTILAEEQVNIREEDEVNTAQVGGDVTYPPMVQAIE